MRTWKECERFGFCPTCLEKGDTKMKKWLLLEAAALLLIPSVMMAGQSKVEVCHKGSIIKVAARAVPAHLTHGDNVAGPEVCDGVDNDCDSAVDEDSVCAICGDLICTSPPEDVLSCPQDCAVCGDGLCSPGEEGSCADCGYCGDGMCSPGEENWCTIDCGGCSGYTCQTGQCIPQAWVCDGWPDCPLGDDEASCP